MTISLYLILHNNDYNNLLKIAMTDPDKLYRFINENKKDFLNFHLYTFNIDIQKFLYNYITNVLNGDKIKIFFNAFKYKNYTFAMYIFNVKYIFKYQKYVKKNNSDYCIIFMKFIKRFYTFISLSRILNYDITKMICKLM